MTPLTHRQSEVLAMIEAFRVKHGFSPSTREIQRHFGFASQTAAVQHLRCLRKKGVVNWAPKRARTVSAGTVTDLPANEPRFTYIFHDAVSGKVKIGRTSDILERQMQLETAYPCKLSLLVLLPAAEWPELAVHRRFKADRLRGEWFNYSDAIKEFVSTTNSRS